MLTSLILGISGLSALIWLRQSSRRKVKTPPVERRAEPSIKTPHLPTWQRKTARQH